MKILLNKITSIKGLGIWSAKMFLIFVLGRENIIPFEDMAYIQSFLWYNNYLEIPNKNTILDICNKWTPYNSIVARYFYKALDKGFTQKSYNSYNNYKQQATSNKQQATSPPEYSGASRRRGNGSSGRRHPAPHRSILAGRGRPVCIIRLSCGQ
jgi:hypothetical protein